MKIDCLKLELAMARACMTGRALQELAAISDVTLGRIRSGVQEPRPATAGRIAKALGVDIADLIKES